MDTAEFNKWLEDHKVKSVIEQDLVSLTSNEKFTFLICGTHKSRAAFNSTAIEELEKFHNIDARAEIYRMCIEMLEEELEKAAIQFVTIGDADNFFKYFNFRYLEDLVGKYPKLIYDVANYEKFKPKERQDGKDPKILSALP